MYVKHGDFDPTNPVQEGLVEIAAEAAAFAGSSSFTVSSMTCCHAWDIDDPHNYGMAMDVVLDKPSRAPSFENYLTDHLPLGSQILGPDGFGVLVTAGGISPFNMAAIDTRRGSPGYGSSYGNEHSGHFHIEVPRGWVP